MNFKIIEQVIVNLSIFPAFSDVSLYSGTMQFMLLLNFSLFSLSPNTGETYYSHYCMP